MKGRFRVAACRAGMWGNVEGVVRVRWCENCFGWHCERSWVLLSEPSSTTPWSGGPQEIWVPADEWSDRNMTKLVTGAAGTARIMAEAEARGQGTLTA